MFYEPANGMVIDPIFVVAKHMYASDMGHFQATRPPNLHQRGQSNKVVTCVCNLSLSVLDRFVSTSRN
jgi:hypothetical protein